MKNGKKKVAAAFLAGIILGISGTWFMYNGVFESVNVSKVEYDKYADAYNRLSKAAGLYQYIKNNYYKEVDGDTIVEGMYKGMFDALGDKYSEYMTAEEYKDWSANLSGEYSGVGITMSMNDDGEVQAVSILEDSPAEEAGIKAGDIILKVDGKTYDNLADFASAVRGKKDTEVKITYRHKKKEQTVTLTRKTLKLPSVASKLLDDKIGYIAISSFSEDTGDDFSKAVAEMEEAGAKSLIIDLRNNGGGLVDEGLDVADTLLGKCKVVTYVDSDGNRTCSYSDKSKTDLPYVLLVNENTASASEILTAAVKDNDGGEIVGTRTYGKGVIQSTSRLSDGSAVKLTVMEYLSPEGHKINGKGIKPDYTVKLKSGDSRDYQLEKAEKLLQ